MQHHSVTNSTRFGIGMVAMLEGQSDHGLASVDEAESMVRCIESMLQTR